MAKIDVYLRSIEKFGATGAILTSGQAITLRFPQGDRNATQVTPHDQLVGMIREIASPPALDQIDGNRPARFDFESSGFRYSIDVQPRPGAWQVTITGSSGAAAVAPAPAPASAGIATAPTTRIPARPASAPSVSDGDDMMIERGQYVETSPGAARGVSTTSGSGLLDQWTTAARSGRASDIYINTGAAPVARVNGALQALGDRGPLDAETIAREVGIVAPAEARAAWTEHGIATFTYSDPMGRVRATLTRDYRGPGAALRLLVGEPPAIERLGIGPQVGPWLESRGLVLVAGPSGAGKTTTLAALVRSIGDKGRRVVTLEDPIEIIATSSSVSQRALGEHVPTVIAGVAAAMREGADAIAIGHVGTADAAVAVLDAVASANLVLAAIGAASARDALDHLIDMLPAERRELGRNILAGALLGTICPVAKGGSRSFDVVASRGG